MVLARIPWISGWVWRRWKTSRRATGYLQEAAEGAKTAIEGDRRTELVMEEDGLLEELQQHLVEAVEFDDRSVILLHELFDGQVVAAVVDEAEVPGQGALVVEQQAVLAPAGQAMELEADAP